MRKPTLEEKMHALIQEHAASIGNPDDLESAVLALQNISDAGPHILWGNIDLSVIPLEEIPISFDTEGQNRNQQIAQNPTLPKKLADKLWDWVQRSFAENEGNEDLAISSVRVAEILIARQNLVWPSKQMQALWKSVNPSGLPASDKYYSSTVQTSYLDFILRLPGLPLSVSNQICKSARHDNNLWGAILLAAHQHSGSYLLPFLNKYYHTLPKDSEDRIEGLKSLTSWAWDSHNWNTLDPDLLLAGWDTSIITTTQMAAALKILSEPTKSRFIVDSARLGLWDPITYWLHKSLPISDLTRQAKAILLTHPSKNIRESVISMLAESNPVKKNLKI